MTKIERLHTHRVTADSIAGRRMAQAKGSALFTESKDPHIREHNRKIEEARAAKLAAKEARRSKK